MHFLKNSTEYIQHLYIDIIEVIQGYKNKLIITIKRTF